MPRPCTCGPETRTSRWPTLFARDRQHVFLEGGAALAAAFLQAGLVDEIVVYVAPMLLGAGTHAVADLGINTIGDAFRPRVTDVTVLSPVGDEEPNLRLTLTGSSDPTHHVTEGA